MSNNIRLGFSLFLLMASVLSYAQPPSCNLSLEGHISMADAAAAPAGAASVFLPKTKKGIRTDSLGNFVLTGLCPGKLQIVISYEGYKSIDTTIRITQDHQTLGFSLASTATQMSSVTVSGGIIRKDQISTAVKSTLSGQALDETRGSSLGESLKSISGVNSLQTGPSISKPIIHGVYSNRILILNNGVRQEGQNWGNDHAPEIDPFIATKITVIKGAASIRYGSDAIGGVVLLDPKEMRKEPGVDGELNLVGISNGRVGVASGMVEGAASGKLEGLSWRLQGTLKKAGNAEAAHYYLGNTGFHENDYSATLQYDKTHYGAALYYSRFNTKIGIATASEVGSASDFINTPAVPAVKSDFTYDFGRPYQTVNHQLVKASAFVYLPHNGGKLEATYAYQRDVRTEFDADPSYNSMGSADNIPDLDFQLNTSTVDLIWEHPAIKKAVTGSIGVDFITHGNLEQGTTYVQLIPNFVDYSGGIFAIEKMQIKKLTLEAGLRYDYRWLQVYRLDPTTLVKNSPIENWQNLTVNAGATYRFNDHFSWTFNFGSAWRPPSVLELWADGIHQSAASWQFGDSALKLEKAYNFSTAVKYSSDDFDAELGVYANDFQNYIYARPDSFVVSTIQGTFPSFTYTQIKHALFEGFDLNLTYRFWDHFSLTSKTSIVRARDLDLHQWIINVPADRFDNTLRYQWKKIGKVKNFYVGANNLVVSKQSRVLPLPSPGTPLTTAQKVYSKLVSAPAGYMLWGAEAGCTVPVAHQEVRVSLSVTNLTNVAYRDYLNLFRYYMDDLGRIVTLRLVVPFGAK
jgi:iron complex outermembrane receptor protein